MMTNAQPDRKRRPRSAPSKPPRPNPAELYPPPPGEGSERLGVGLRGSHTELRAMDLPALEWDLRRVRRALAAFTPAEVRSAYGTKEFDGSWRNPVVLWTAAYPYLLSDYLQDRELFILRELRRRGEEGET
jgi:hypothetical protein